MSSVGERYRDVSAELNNLSHLVIDAALEVHRVLGPGFLETVYEEALCMEFHERGISFARQPFVAISYKGKVVGEGRLDLLVGGASNALP